MIEAIIICSIICLLMILSVLFFPKIKLGKLKIDSYWVITLIGAIILMITGLVNVKNVTSSILADTSINPLKILVLFISMTILSIYLDELGFFRYLASVTLKKAKTSQITLFLYLYIIVSILTVFTSNDIIILSFTPFICYFAKNAKINPIPYLAAEFVAANTWSMCLIIGNPTNIYLSTAYGINFIEYLKIMFLPTIVGGVVAILALLLLFRKKLKEPINGSPEEVKITDKLSLIIGLIHLGVCTLLLAIGSYINLDMWLVSLMSAVSLFLITIIIAMFRKKKPYALVGCLKRAPYELIPFILSMFVIIVCLSENNVTKNIASLLSNNNTVFKYGIVSFLSANVINNIPMSVLFVSVIENAENINSLQAVFATIVGSNVGAFFTPIGALAGIMWSSILNEHHLKFKYLDFIKIGITIAIPTLLAILIMLTLIL